ncbi:MAG: Wzz/FepE/Etk N-terminal domain-containing protein [candidate division Zixibacteria bacterium]|nr:Wzz/FepE/Etk N-terminal domain-containing protein [candidate division Zixibacteria bacterium]
MTGESRTNFWVFLELLARRRGLIFSLVLIVTVAAAVISFLLPKWYSATALLLPPPDDSGRSAGLSSLTEITTYTGGIRVPGLVTPNDVYARMLRSRRIADKLAEKFNLMERYDAENATALYLALTQHTSVGVTDEGLLSLSVEDRDPRIAADMATNYVNELVELNRELLSTSARTKREFIEARLGEVRSQLDGARQELERFQLDNRTVNLDEQARLALNQAVDLKVEQARIDLDIRMAEQRLGAQHPELAEKKERLRLINRQLEELEWSGAGDSSFFSVPISAIPGLRGKYESLFARVRVSESLYETLLELYEQARIQEQEDSPTITVLDWPRVPDLRARPQRTIIILASFLCSLIVATFLAAWLEFVKRMRETRPDDYQRLSAFAGAYFGWLPGVRRNVRR